MKSRRLILVTGPPRSGTTPVGNILAKCKGAVAIYEPLGTTGMLRINDRFPIAGDGLDLSRAELKRLIDDLASFRFGPLKSQQRHADRASIFTTLFGSRTLHSIRLAYLQPWSRVVIWKDPHAVFLVPDLVGADIDIVVTARTPRAHAASYKRLGWHSKAADVYPRWSMRFGRCSTCEEFLEQEGNDVVSAALLWRMSYLPLLRTDTLDKVHLITSSDLQADERTAYFDLMKNLSLVPTRRVQRALSRRPREAAAAEMSRKAHDWTRSIASVSNYWREVLTNEDIDKVDRITSDLVPPLFGELQVDAAAESFLGDRSTARSIPSS